MSRAIRQGTAIHTAIMEGRVPEQPDLDICSKCGEHTAFEREQDDKLYSVCCGEESAVMP